jgi:large subunit ribosomal protein L19e
MQEERVRKIAAGLLNCGNDRVWFDPEQQEKVKSAMTKEDIRALIKEKAIKKRNQNFKSRGRARILREKRKKGRKRGKGKRKGTKKARSEKKESWMKNVRSQRRLLKQMKKEKPKAVAKLGYRRLYKMVKGGYFKGKKYLKAAVEGKKA